VIGDDVVASRPLSWRHRERELTASIARRCHGINAPRRAAEPHLPAEGEVLGEDVDPQFPVVFRTGIADRDRVGERGVSVLDTGDVPTAAELAQLDPEVHLRFDARVLHAD
jgi:hypothetical protein